jgi:S-adenosyl methyltransferase
VNFDRTFERPAPQGVDVSVAHSARVYDWWLGGKDNFAADRELGEKIVDLVPMTWASCRANRAFLHRAAGIVAKAGVRQFLDLGAGLPTVENTHTVVQRVNPANGMVYVDYDPLVVAHARALLAGNGPTIAVQADIRDPEAILTDPEVTGFIDFARPLCVLAVAVLHFVTDAEDPYAVVNRLRQAMTPGSYLVLSHITGDGTSQAEADEVFALTRKYMVDPPTPRAYGEVRRFFAGFDLLDPGLVPVDHWQPDNQPQPARPGQTPHSGDEPFWMYAGVARKPD